MEKDKVPNGVVYFKDFQEPISITVTRSEPFVEKKRLALVTNVD